METGPNDPSPAAPFDRAVPRRAFARARAGVEVHGVLGVFSLLAVVAVVAVAGGGHPVRTFMRVRAVLLPLAAVPVHHSAVSASRSPPAVPPCPRLPP
ncbi:hypothetical protein [Streptomyces sp. NK15101]|uniref:hypothetical protein n=1 Tax=Streptomyces sp. NK15101 TaxID=2873261 RepID=UPI001CECA4DC|nr:hypothetical protein [Streptomyces sp. NK15101]